MKFNCLKCNGEDGENKLMLMVKNIESHRFYINSDGSLEHYDSDNDGQEIYLHCEYCGQKYEFENDFFELHNSFVLKLFVPSARYNGNYINPKVSDMKFKIRED